MPEYELSAVEKLIADYGRQTLIIPDFIMMPQDVRYRTEIRIVQEFDLKADERNLDNAVERLIKNYHFKSKQDYVNHLEDVLNANFHRIYKDKTLEWMHENVEDVCKSMKDVLSQEAGKFGFIIEEVYPVERLRETFLYPKFFSNLCIQNTFLSLEEYFPA